MVILERYGRQVVHLDGNVNVLSYRRRPLPELGRNFKAKDVDRLPHLAPVTLEINGFFAIDMKIILNIIKIQIGFLHRALLAARRKGDFLEKIRNQKKVSPSTVNLDPDPLHKQHHRHLVDHLVGAEDEDASSEERQDGSDEDEGVPVVEVRRLHEATNHDDDQD